MQRLYLLFFFLTPIWLQAQDITGIWEGHFRSNVSESAHSFSLDDRYRFEVQVAQRGKTFEAVTYSYLSSFFYGKASAKGTVNVHTQKVLLQEGKLLEFRNDMGGVYVAACFLQYTKSGDEEFLEGRYVSMNVNDSSNCGKGTVFLRKVQNSQFTLNIYDDGAIDHDTISVYLDNGLVISHAMLTDRPITLTLHLDETNDYHELVMVAENEGIHQYRLPMIVKAGDKRCKCITSTEQKNAMVTQNTSGNGPHLSFIVCPVLAVGRRAGGIWKGPLRRVRAAAIPNISWSCRSISRTTG